MNSSYILYDLLELEHLYSIVFIDLLQHVLLHMLLLIQLDVQALYSDHLPSSQIQLTHHIDLLKQSCHYRSNGQNPTYSSGSVS